MNLISINDNEYLRVSQSSSSSWGICYLHEGHSGLISIHLLRHGTWYLWAQGVFIYSFAFL